MAKATVQKEEQKVVKVEVKYYETNSARKNNEVLGVFTIPVIPREVKPVNEELEGDALERDKARFAADVDKADLALRTDALKRVHEITHWTGVLVARVLPEETEEV